MATVEKIGSPATASSFGGDWVSATPDEHQSEISPNSTYVSPAMASRASIDTLDTQTVRKLRSAWRARQAAQPDSQVDAGYEQPQNVMNRESPPRAEPADSMNAVPLDFSLATQATQRRDSGSQISSAAKGISNKTSPAETFDHARNQERKMHYSFADIGLEAAGGDTQPMTTQEFRDHSDIWTSRVGLDTNTGLLAGECIATVDSEILPSRGHDVDLTKVVEKRPEEDDEFDVSSLTRTDEVSPAAHVRIQAQTAPLFKVPQPKTPGTVARKRNWHDMMSPENHTSSTKRPDSAFKAMLGNTGFPLNMTQLFANTQVGSSPPAGAPPSDTVFDRPSPNAFMQPSSPRAVAISSPVRPLNACAIHNEPLNFYERMEDSQMSRARRRQLEEEERMNHDSETDEMDDGWVERIRQRNTRQRERSAFVKEIQLTAPERSSRSRRTKSLDYLSSERNLQTPAPNVTNIQPISPDESSDLPNIVQGQSVGSTAAGIQVPMTSSKLPRGSHTRNSQQPSPSSSQKSLPPDFPTQLTVAVQDSQGEGHRNPFNSSSAAPLAAPSSALSGNRIAQSQYAAPIHEDHQMLSQRQHNKRLETVKAGDIYGDTLLERDETIPSSPPIEFSEHDHDFDDHLVHEFIEDEPNVDGMHDEHSKENVNIDEEADELPVRRRNPVHTTKCAHAQYQTRSSLSERLVGTETSNGNHTVVGTDTENYETAASRQVASAGTPIQGIQKSQQELHDSPIKRLQDIATAPLPNRSGESFQSQEIDGLISTIFTDGDKEFMNMTSDGSPSQSTKRLRTYTKKRSVLYEPSLNANISNVSRRDKTDSEEITRAISVAAPAKFVNQSVEQVASHIETPSIPSTDMPFSAKQKELKSEQAVHVARRLATYHRNIARRSPKPKRQRTTDKGQRMTEANARRHVEDAARQNKTIERSVDSNFPLISSAVHDSLAAAQVTHPDTAPSAHRVLALFKGHSLYYYPATYLETVFQDGEKYRVRFYDGTVSVVDPLQVRSLELRIDDCVKVDLNGMRKGTYLIQDFDHISGASYTDAGGHNAVKLVSKTADGTAAPQVPITVSVERIYLTGSMLPAFADRKFLAPIRKIERFATPALHISEPTSPGSRSRRQNVDTRVHGMEQTVTSDLFSNMLFAVTFVNIQTQQKDTIIKSIISRGGSLVDDGFHGIFDYNAAQAASPSKSPARFTTNGGFAREGLRLKPHTQYLGFTAVIADRHCRKEKYLQALALGVPCLHHRWITDCISQSTILHFERYLLPAGDSEFLGGAVHSRLLVPYAPDGNEAALQKVFDRRSVPLRNSTILLAMSSADRQKTYKFLAYAAGAKSVNCAQTLSEAKEILSNGLVCDWVICDSDKTKARDVVFGMSQREGGKKRKKKVGITRSNIGTSVKVVDSEFLVQTLILGALADA
ncbi:hypothetical protein, variant 1 [Verruconis gallopava]|uniref:BRCT domain-containing protein n=1 Tax=Verruconis gallopava TaxID=253628 RepID=A0A0D1Z2V9_9PEZI|nr:hypothetical protein, variant 1 [Verruconis gallopava]KIW07287.1 hypothetical protein, variant 1 [Verruconis gallopava]